MASKLILPRRFAAEAPKVSSPGNAPAHPFENIATPIHLTTRTLVIPRNSAGGVNAVALRNPHGHAMEIQEFKFRVWFELEEEANGQLVNGAAMMVALTLVNPKGDKRTILTNGPMSLWSFGPARDVPAEIDGAATPVVFFVAEYCWPLTQPFYIPPGYGVEPVVSTTSTTFNTDTPMRFEMSVSGRAMDPRAPRPTESKVPFAAGYTSKPFNINGAADTDVSQETDLMNVTGKLLHVDRFIGRFCVFDDVSGFSGDTAGEEANRTTVIRVMNSRGDAIVDRYTPFRTILNAEDRAMEVPHVMRANDFYQVFVDKLDPVNNNDGQTATVYFSMTGWRSVPLREL